MSREHSDKDVLPEHGYYQPEEANSMWQQDAPPPSYADVKTPHPYAGPGQTYGGYGGAPPSAYNGYNNVTVFSQPGRAPQQPPTKVPDYMALSIVSILFCTCLGIVSIVKASNSRTSKAVGNYEQAIGEARSARSYAIAGIVVGIILTVLYIAIRVAAASASSS